MFEILSVPFSLSSFPSTNFYERSNLLSLTLLGYRHETLMGYRALRYPFSFEYLVVVNLDVLNERQRKLLLRK